MKNGVSSLRGSLERVEGYLQQVEEEFLTTGERGAKKTTKKKTTRRRRGKRFPIADFVLAQLEKSPKSMRPKDIAAALKEEAPGAHKDPAGVVSNTLTRLRGQKKVAGRAGKWRLVTGGGAAVKVSPKKKVAKKKAGKKKTAKRKVKRTAKKRTTKKATKK